MAKEGEIFLGIEQVSQGPPLGRTNNRKEEEGVKDRGGNMQERSPDGEALKSGVWSWPCL